MSGGAHDPIEAARLALENRLVEEATARARAEAAEQFKAAKAQFEQFAQQHPEFARAVLNGVAQTPAPAAPSDPFATVGDVAREYRIDPKSTYNNSVRFRTRASYDQVLRRVEEDLGPVSLDALNAALLWDKFAEWREARGETMAHSIIGGLRMLGTYGWQHHKSRACRELKMTLHDMRFPSHSRSRKREPMTREDVNKIRAKAHEMDLPLIALAQALQFETGLKQTDIIGEWVPPTDEGTSEIFTEITHRKMKWIRGLRGWSIDQNNTLRHTRSQTDKEFICDLADKDMVMEELRRLTPRPSGATPLIIDPDTDQPYLAHKFRRTWRKVADAAGIAKTVFNMDARPESVEPGPRRIHRRKAK